MLSTANSHLRASFALLLVILAIAMLPMPSSRMRSMVRQLRSSEPNRADREAHAGGYYLGLIEGTADTSRDELSLRLMGKTSDWKSFHEIDATKYLRGDFLQFELKPNVRETMFGRSFTTNSHGLRDREYTVEKPQGVFRIALLGSSMDMGWGVGTDETYENQLEDWLNLHATKRGISRKFEVVNFAMAAYSPLHRVESFQRKALSYKPDLVLYSATMLDTRLLEINLRNLVTEGIAPPYEFLRAAMSEMHIQSSDRKADKDLLKAKVKPHLDEINSAAIANLKQRCQSESIPLAMVLVPRVGESDSPENRALGVTKFTALAKSLELPLLDLSPTFDERDTASIEIAAWDDHPNVLGHKLLFQALAHKIVDNTDLYEMLFGTPPPSIPLEATR
jgi:hypothetical protein